MSLRRWGLLLCVLTGLVPLAIPGGASAETQTASLGGVTATLSYETGPNSTYLNVRETIARGGVTAFDQPAGPPPECQACTIAPASQIPGTPAVSVVHLDRSPEPEVIFDLWTGGAHCCFYSQIYRFNGASYDGITHNWFDPGYALEDLNGDGLPEFVSGDARFDYEFGSFATTQFPPQIWRYDSGALTDVTRQFPAVVAADAQQLRRRYERGKNGPKFRSFVMRQTLLTYTADECLLGTCSKGFALVRHAVRAGQIDRGRAYLGKLRRFLRATGYA